MTKKQYLLKFTEGLNSKISRLSLTNIEVACIMNIPLQVIRLPRVIEIP